MTETGCRKEPGTKFMYTREKKSNTFLNKKSSTGMNRIISIHTKINGFPCNWRALKTTSYDVDYKMAQRLGLSRWGHGFTVSG